jgi:hypothetical protein
MAIHIAPTVARSELIGAKPILAILGIAPLENFEISEST